MLKYDKTLLGMIFVSVFGLTSCSEDKEAAVKDDFKVEKPKFQTDSQVVSFEEGVHSQINFHSEDLLRFNSPEATQVDFKILCSTGNENYRKTLSTTYQNTYKLLQLLPETALGALDEGIVSCDFDVTAFNDNGSTHQFLLQRVSIEINPESYLIKLSKNLIDPQEITSIDEQDAYDIHLQLAETKQIKNADSKKIKLVCSDLVASQKYDGETLLMAYLMANLEHTQEPLHTHQSCQLFQLVDQQVAGVSKSFEIKLFRELAKITHKFNVRPLKPENRQVNLAEVALENSSDQPMFFVMPAEKIFRSPTSWWFVDPNGQATNSTSAVSLESSAVIKMSFSNSSWVEKVNKKYQITLPPRETLKVSFATNLGDKCARRHPQVTREKLLRRNVAFKNSPLIRQVDFFGEEQTELSQIITVPEKKLVFVAKDVATPIVQTSPPRTCN